MAQVLNQEAVMVPVESVRPHPKNPRQGDVGAIYQSIEQTGFYGFLVVQKSTGHILAGSHRWDAARQAGMEEVPVVFVDVDDERALRILLADNRTNDLAAYDDNALLAILEDIHAAHGSLIGTGFSDEDLEELNRALNDPMFSPNVSPDLELEQTTQDEVAREKERLETQFEGSRTLKATMCPACGTEFYVD